MNKNDVKIVAMEDTTVGSVYGVTIDMVIDRIEREQPMTLWAEGIKSVALSVLTRLHQKYTLEIQQGNRKDYRLPDKERDLGLELVARDEGEKWWSGFEDKHGRIDAARVCHALGVDYARGNDEPADAVQLKARNLLFSAVVAATRGLIYREAGILRQMRQARFPLSSIEMLKKALGTKPKK